MNLIVQPKRHDTSCSLTGLSPHLPEWRSMGTTCCCFAPWHQIHHCLYSTLKASMPYLRNQPTFHTFILSSLRSGCKRIELFSKGSCSFGLNIDDPKRKEDDSIEPWGENTQPHDLMPIKGYWVASHTMLDPCTSQISPTKATLSLTTAGFILQ